MDRCIHLQDAAVSRGPLAEYHLLCTKIGLSHEPILEERGKGQSVGKVNGIDSTTANSDDLDRYRDHNATSTDRGFRWYYAKDVLERAKGLDRPRL